jgi:hypothetical protein
MIVASLSVAFAAAPSVHVRDLDPTVVPSDVEMSMGRLWVDGQKVRGSRHAQLDYLGELAEEIGLAPEELRIDQRHRALRRFTASQVVSYTASGAGIALTIAFPPALVPVMIAEAAVHGASAAVTVEATGKYRARELARQVDRLNTVASIEPP